MYLSLSNIKKSYSFNDVLDNVTFSVYRGDRIGIVGSNGCGKTTLLKIIYGIEHPNEGELYIQKGLTLGYLDQIPEYNMKVIEVIKMGVKHIYEMQDKLSELEEQLESSNEKLLKTYGNLQEKFIHLDGYNVESKIKTICTGLNLDDSFLDKDFSLLSGGEKSRVILAQILCKNPDILLLDEPSNHLDFSTIMWLEKYLENYQGTVIVISHDRYFLDKVTNKIINIERGKAYIYSGNYTYFINEKEKKDASQEKMYENQQKKIKQLEEAAKRFRQWGAQSDNEAMFVKAKAIEKRIERMDKIEKVYTPEKMKFKLRNPLKTGKGVILTEELSKSFDNKILLDRVNFQITSPDKVCIIGDNGVGKTTLFKMIMGEDEEYSGKLQINNSVQFGYLSQEINYEDPYQTIISNFKDTVPCKDGEARNILAKYLFRGDDVFKYVSDLSGGEKSRLELAKLVNGNANVLLLDEPTNHLDIQARETLEENLLNYQGTLIIISHDRYFINKISDYILEIDNKNVVKYYGDFNYYLAKKEEMKPVPIEKSKKKTVKKVEVKEEKKLSTFKLKQLEEEIHTIEENLKDLESSMFSEEVYSNHELSIERQNQISQLKNKLEGLYEIYLSNS